MSESMILLAARVSVASKKQLVALAIIIVLVAIVLHAAEGVASLQELLLDGK